MPVTDVQRAYRQDSMVLETTFTTATGAVCLTDAMIVDDGQVRVVRSLSGLSGVVPMRMELTIRFDYGSIVPWVRDVDGALVAIAGPDALTLIASVPLRGEGMETVAEFDGVAGATHTFDLAYFPSYGEQPQCTDPLGAIDATDRFWREWASRCTYAGPDREAVVRSLLTLKALIYGPSGAIAAAPTMALPERLGGVRNWDYRYCWLRDTTFVLLALSNAGYEDEALAWRAWLLRAIAGAPDKLQIMYGILGERRIEETELPWLTGFADSRPVRVGNAAVDQFQLDVYGEVVDALYQATNADLPSDPASWSLAQAVLATAEARWREPDRGLWEVRGPLAHFTHSKVLAWVAFDRAVKAIERHGLDGPVDRWRTVRDEIHADVCAHAFDPQRNAFMQAYGSNELDAAVLLIPLVGFLPSDDSRILGTLAAIEAGLMSNGLIHRYSEQQQNDTDGLPPGEGAFLACNFWLVDNYLLAGRRDDARALFDHLLALRNDVGLLAEEANPHDGTMLGNFPQAFSHVGLVNSALNFAHPDAPMNQRSDADTATNQSKSDS